MAYAIIRAAKIKTVQEAGALYSHVVRKEFDQEGNLIIRENVDRSRSDYNTHWQLRGENIHSGIKERLEELNITPRKNAVLGIEYLVSASPEFFDESKNNYCTQGYFTEALRFINERHGKDNVISYTVHMDEMTPHAHIVVVPIDQKGKLNCREYLGGREKLSQLQDDFYDAMKHTSRGVPLDRGEKKGKNEPEKYIARTSPEIASLRHDLQKRTEDIAHIKKSCEEALKALDMERLKIESQKLEREMLRLSQLDHQRKEAEKKLEKDRDFKPKRSGGLSM